MALPDRSFQEKQLQSKGPKPATSVQGLDELEQDLLSHPDNQFEETVPPRAKTRQSPSRGVDDLQNTLEAPFSREVTVRTTGDATHNRSSIATEGNGGEREDERFDVGLELDYIARQAMGAMYGDTFPLLKTDPDDQDWVKWGEALWDRHASAVTHRLHIIERNRLFRMGVQWISSL